MLISFAGLRGSGKTTQSNLLASYFNEHGHPTKIVKALDDEMKTKFVEMIPNNSDITNHFLFCMLYHRQAEKIKELLSQNYTVIADRYIEYFMFYHKYYGLLKTHPYSIYDELRALVFENLNPDIVVFLNIDLLTANSRVKGRILKKERLDNMLETEESHRYMLDFYRTKPDGLNCVEIDALPGPLEVLQSVIEALNLNKTSLAKN